MNKKGIITVIILFLLLIQCEGGQNPGTLTLAFEFTGSANIQFSARVYDANSTLEAALPSSSFFNPDEIKDATIANKKGIILLEVNGSTIQTKEKQLAGGEHTLYVMIDDDGDGSILAENNWLSGNKGLRKTITISGDTIEKLPSADFNLTATVVEVTFNTSIATALENKKAFCTFIVPGAPVTSVEDVGLQFGKSRMVANSFDALGDGITDTYFNIISATYSVYCLIDFDLSGKFNPGEYDTYIENIVVTGETAIFIDSLTQR